MITEILINTFKHRKKAYLPLAALAFSLFLVLFNMNMFFKGKDATSLEHASNYHIRLLNLSKNDLEIIGNDSYTEGYYTEPADEYIDVYVKLKNPDRQYLAETYLHYYDKLKLGQHRTLPTRNKANSAFANYNETAHITPAKPAGRYAGLSRKVRPFG